MKSPLTHSAAARASRAASPPSGRRWCVPAWPALYLFLVLSAHGQIIPPGIPEPGLILWGTVVNQTNATQAIPITSVSWAVSDGTRTVVYSGSTRPATRIVNFNGQSYYLAQVAFDTRQIGTVTLADPATVGISSFELKSSSPPTYILAPTINGLLATVRSIDGAPAAGESLPVAGFSSATRGRILRVDLGIIPSMANDYDAWAAGFFGSPTTPDADRTADPDGDGLTNEGEFAAGTDPTDDTSVFQVLTFAVQGDTLEASIDWRSATGRSYVIEYAPAPNGPWEPVGNPIPAAGTTTQGGLSLPGGVATGFFRVRLAP